MLTTQILTQFFFTLILVALPFTFLPRFPVFEEAPPLFVPLVLHSLARGGRSREKVQTEAEAATTIARFPLNQLVQVVFERQSLPTFAHLVQRCPVRIRQKGIGTDVKQVLGAPNVSVVAGGDERRRPDTVNLGDKFAMRAVFYKPLHGLVLAANGANVERSVPQPMDGLGRKSVVPKREPAAAAAIY